MKLLRLRRKSRFLSLEELKGRIGFLPNFRLRIKGESIKDFPFMLVPKKTLVQKKLSEV